jgi:vacuolar-type H+-ATPase subunit I/STV1
MKHDNPKLKSLIDEILASHDPSAMYIDEPEFSSAVTKLEKKLIQFLARDAYLVSNRNLHEYTLTLKDSTKESSESEDNGDEGEQYDETANLNIVTDMIRRSKESMVNRSLDKREIHALEMLQMNYNII